MRDAVASTIHSLIYDVNNASIMEEEPTSRSCICIQHRKENDIETGATVCWITKNSSRIDNTPMIKIKIVFCTFLNFTFEKFLEVVFWMHAAEVVRRESWGNISIVCHQNSSKPLYW